MTIYKTKAFNKWQTKENLADNDLINAINEIESGLVDAELGGGLLKKRIAKRGSGKSSGYRTIIATRFKGIWFFMYGFAKNEKESISIKEKDSIIEFANNLLNLNVKEQQMLAQQKIIFEVYHDKK